MGNLLSKLIQRQGTRSDYAFIQEFQVTRSLWSMTRTGKRPISLSILKATVKTYPELIPDVILFLSDGAIILPNTENYLSELHQAHQNNPHAGLFRQLIVGVKGMLSPAFRRAFSLPPFFRRQG